MKNKLAGAMNIAIGILMIVYYVVMFVLTILGTYVPKESENWEGLGYAVGFVLLLLTLIAGVILSIINCVLACIAGKKLIESEESGRIPKVLMVISGIFNTLNLICIFLIIAFLASFPNVIAYIVAAGLVMFLIVVSVVLDCMVRGGVPAVKQAQSVADREAEYPESYGFDNEN